MGKERCCLRGLDHLHGPTSHSICGHFMIYKPSLNGNDRLKHEHEIGTIDADCQSTSHFRPHMIMENLIIPVLHRWMNREQNFWLTMFPEKRYFRETTSTTEVAIHTNLFTDLYASIGTGTRTGGWYTTIMKLPFMFLIRIGFLLASLGGSRSLLRQLIQKEKLRWN